MLTKFKILESDHPFAYISDDTCSRCREPLAEFDVPLRLWPKDRPGCMFVYCEKCLENTILTEES